MRSPTGESGLRSVEQHVDDLVAAEVLEGRRRDAPSTVEFPIDLMAQDAADLAMQGGVVVVSGRVGDDPGDHHQPRASAPDGYGSEGRR